MLLLSLPRPAPLAFWEHTARFAGEETVSPTVYVLLLALACCGGALHGLAMAIRKKYGEGIEKYWLEWKWWVGTIADGCAGFMIWPAMPYVSVQIFAPLVIIFQLGTSYVLGLVMFKEKCVLMHNCGLACAVIGVIGVSLSTTHEAAHFTISQFWAGWVNPRFVMTNLVVFAVLAGARVGLHISSFYALLAAALEGFQYICSRSIVDSIFEHSLAFIMKPAVFGAFIIKGCCILGIVHTQQLGLESDLSRFAGIYLVGCTLFMCIQGSAFFGDPMPMSIGFFASAFCTLAGIWMLNQKAVEEPKDISDKEITITDSEDAPKEGNPQDSVA